MNKVCSLFITAIVTLSFLCTPVFSGIPYKITIENYDELKAFIKGGTFICYDRKGLPLTNTPINDSNLVVPFDTEKIEFRDSVLSGETFFIDREKNILSIPIATKFFIPVDQKTSEHMDRVFIKIEFVNAEKYMNLTQAGTFSFRKKNDWIKIIYPTAIENVYLTIKKEGYEDWLSDISSSSFKEAPASNIIEMKIKEKETFKRVAFSIKNGGGARVTIGGNSKVADSNGNTWLDIDPYKEKEFKITKEGFVECHGTFTLDQVFYEIFLEPIMQPTIVTNISISNEAHYFGQVILTDNLSNIYKIPITQPETQVPIEGNQIISAKLEPESLPKNGKTYRIHIKQAGNGCKIILIEERMLAIVVFITNSRYALQRQDEIDQGIRPVFSLKSNYKDLYVGWVDYNKTYFQLREFKNSKGQQICITDVNLNDSTDASLNKIIYSIKARFSGINASEEQKQFTDKLVVILDKTVIYMDIKDYSTRDLKVQLIDINDIINKPNGQFLNLIKED